MKLESEGILIAMRPINERDALAHIFSRDCGVVAGVMRGAVVAKKNKPLVGQVGGMIWNARLDSQLGTFHWDADKNIAANLMIKPVALMAMNAAFALIDALLPEREEYSNLYDATIELIKKLSLSDVGGAYLDWEIKLLHYLGYALHLLGRGIAALGGRVPFLEEKGILRLFPATELMEFTYFEMKFTCGCSTGFEIYMEPGQWRYLAVLAAAALLLLATAMFLLWWKEKKEARG